MFKFIKENILGIKPVFKIKLEPLRFFNSYYLKFSNNNGWSWDYIKTSHEEVTAEYPRKLIDFKVISGNDLKTFTSQFKTYEDCIQYNEKLQKEVREYNEQSYLTYLKQDEEIQDFVNKFNKGE